MSTAGPPEEARTADAGAATSTVAEPVHVPPPARASGGHPAARALPSQRELGIAQRRRNEYLPTLFHRLMDDAPQQRKEAPSAYAPTRRQIRDMVQRDLVYLLNTANQQDRIDVYRHPAVVSATVNYGVPPLTGGYASEQRWAQVEQAIRIAILRFEPRIAPQSLQVRPLVHGDDRAHYNVLVFEISGLLHLEPYPLEFTVQSSVDLETQQMTLLAA